MEFLQPSCSVGQRAQADYPDVQIPSFSIMLSWPSRLAIGHVNDATLVSREWDRDAHGRESVHRAAELISAAVASKQRWTVEGIASQVGISAGHLHRLFKKHMNLSPKAFAGTQCMQTNNSSHTASASASASQVTPEDQMISYADSSSSVFGSLDLGAHDFLDPQLQWGGQEDNLLDEFMNASFQPGEQPGQEWPWYADDGTLDFSAFDIAAAVDGPIMEPDENSHQSGLGTANSAYMVL